MMCGLADKIAVHLNREHNDSLSSRQNRKLVIRFKVRSHFSCGYFLKCSHLAIPAKLHVTGLTIIYCTLKVSL